MQGVIHEGCSAKLKIFHPLSEFGDRQPLDIQYVLKKCVQSYDVIVIIPGSFTLFEADCKSYVLSTVFQAPLPCGLDICCEWPLISLLMLDTGNIILYFCEPGHNNCHTKMTQFLHYV